MTKPLWPQPIPILGLTGEHESGKTWFGISIAPDPARVRVYDLEMSADPYRSLGFDHVNVPQQMLAKYPKGYKPVDLWLWWLNDVSNLEPDRFDVILVDPVTDLERGLTDWVEANPGHFGHTSGQYNSMSGIKWGDVKDYWKSILLGRVATKCQTFAFVAHMGAEFDSATKKPTGERKPKGKETLEEIATLYLQLERKKDGRGNKPAVPSAVVLKSRLNHMRMTEDGPVIRPALPPRLPVATPRAVRDYMLNPPDYENLKDGEVTPDRVLTADERLAMEIRRAEAERDAAALKAEQAARAESRAAAKPASDSAPAGAPAAAQTTAPGGNSPESFEANFAAGIEQAQTEDALKALGAEMKAALDKGWIRQTHRDRLAAKFKARVAELRTAKPAAVVTDATKSDPVRT